jgi:hypothetical protein
MRTPKKLRALRTQHDPLAIPHPRRGVLQAATPALTGQTGEQGEGVEVVSKPHYRLRVVRFSYGCWWHCVVPGIHTRGWWPTARVAIRNRLVP